MTTKVKLIPGIGRANPKPDLQLLAVRPDALGYWDVENVLASHGVSTYPVELHRGTRPREAIDAIIHDLRSK